MIILHKAQRVDGKGEVKGFLTKMWGEYHIILEHDENTAYPVLEETIAPCNDKATEIINKRKIKLLDGEIQSFWFKSERNPCGCGSNLFHEEFNGKTLYGVCNACDSDIYELKFDADYIEKSEWKYK